MRSASAPLTDRLEGGTCQLAFRHTDPAPIDDVRIGVEVICLGQYLKFAGLLDSGGSVKEAIIDGYDILRG